jgi:hypothetical protein
MTLSLDCGGCTLELLWTSTRAGLALRRVAAPLASLVLCVGAAGCSTTEDNLGGTAGTETAASSDASSAGSTSGTGGVTSSTAGGTDTGTAGTTGAATSATATDTATSTSGTSATTGSSETSGAATTDASTGTDGSSSDTSTGGCGGTACDGDSYCDWTTNRCGAAGEEATCEPLPQGCPDVVMPVCGCDGQVYGNACEAAAAGVDVAEDGMCEPPPGFALCGTQLCEIGVTYCQISVSDVGGFPNGYDCRPLPPTCGNPADCTCVADQSCGEFCEVSGDGLVVVSCPGG